MAAAGAILFSLVVAAAVGPPAPPGAVEGDFLEVDGQVYEVHGGKLYTLDDPALDDARLTISVSGSNIASARKKRVVRTDVITSADIAESGAHTLGDILSQQAGIQVNPSFGLGQDVQLDGLDSRQVLILVDGRPVKGRVDSHVDVSRLPVSGESIERIEIVRGPVSALYGSEAIGGVINVVTKKPSAAVGGEVDAGAQLIPGKDVVAGSTLWSTLGLHGHGGAGPVAARVDVTGSNLPGFDRGGVAGGVDDPDGKADLPERRQLGLHAEAATAIGDDVDFRAALDGSSSQSVARTVGDAAGVPSFSERARDDEWSIAAVLEGDLGPAALSADLRIDRFGHVFDKLPSGAAGAPGFCSDGGFPGVDPACPAKPVLNTDAVEDETRAEGKATVPVVADVLDASAGVVVTREQDHRKNGAGDDTLPGNGERDVASIYAELSYSPFSWLSLAPGARADAFLPAAKNTNLAVSPKLAAKADVGAGVSVRASYGHGFRLPSYEERLLRFDHSELGYFVLGNADLLPEESNSFRGGVAWDVEQVSLSAETYLNLVDGLIDFDATDDTQSGVPVFTYVNRKHAYTSGVDLRAALGPWFGFSLEGGYQYLINAVDASACPKANPYFCADLARSLPLRPAHSGNGALQWRYAPWGTELFTRVDGVSERPIDATTTAPGYVQLSAGVKQTFSNVEVMLSAGDLFDAYDATLGPKPGRSVSLLLRVWN